jgi:hypothetical protein
MRFVWGHHGVLMISQRNWACIAPPERFCVPAFSFSSGMGMTRKHSEDTRRRMREAAERRYADQRERDRSSERARDRYDAIVRERMLDVLVPAWVPDDLADTYREKAVRTCEEDAAALVRRLKSERGTPVPPG